MKKFGINVLNFFGLQGDSTKETVYKVINWLTVAGLFISFVVWVYCVVPNDMEGLVWMVLVVGILVVINLISWWGICREEIRCKKKSTGWRIAELVLWYLMFAILFGLPIFLPGSEDGWRWESLLIVTIFIVIPSGARRLKNEEIGW